LLFIVSGASFISKKIKEQENLTKRTYLLDPGSEIRDPEKFIPDPGVKKHRIPDLGSRIRIRNTDGEQ
jgi:hypothetical protein